MFHSIISTEDIFYQPCEYNSEDIQYKNNKVGIVEMRRFDGELKPFSIFSTNPKAYLNWNR